MFPDRVHLETEVVKRAIWKSPEFGKFRETATATCGKGNAVSNLDVDPVRFGKNSEIWRKDSRKARRPAAVVSVHLFGFYGANLKSREWVHEGQIVWGRNDRRRDRGGRAGVPAGVRAERQDRL